ncbi:MAG: hypothetical protein JWN18_698 [Parcubacteria group bacterium]|nr:hypothetical protein [Parcubacteria group bacterium]
MKKFLLMGFLVLVGLVTFAPTTSAVSCASGGTCKSACASGEVASESGSRAVCQSTPFTGICCVPIAAVACADANAVRDSSGNCVTQSTPGNQNTAITQTNSPQGFTALAPIPGLTDQSNTAVVNSTSLANFLNNLYKYLIGLAAVIAIIEIIWGGLEISTKDSVSKQSDGKNRIYQAVLGLILVLLPALVFSIINPSILNLSINPRALDTTTISSNTNPGTSPGTAVTNSDPSGCTTSGTLYKQANCPSDTAATAFVAQCNSNGGTGKLLGCSAMLPGGCAARTATCESGSAVGPYIFVDVSSQNNALNPLFKFNDYQPLISSQGPSNLNGDSGSGAKAVQFAATCTQDGGATCLTDIDILARVSCTNINPIDTTKIIGKCYSSKITCISPLDINTGLRRCENKPSWSPKY